MISTINRNSHITSNINRNSHINSSIITNKNTSRNIYSNIIINYRVSTLKGTINWYISIIFIVCVICFICVISSRQTAVIIHNLSGSICHISQIIYNSVFVENFNSNINTWFLIWFNRIFTITVNNCTIPVSYICKSNISIICINCINIIFITHESKY